MIRATTYAELNTVDTVEWPSKLGGLPAEVGDSLLGGVVVTQLS
jgi:hypothetical protein